MNDNPLFDGEPAVPATIRQSNPPVPHAGSFVIFTGWVVFALCLIAGLVMYVKLENERVGERDEYGRRSRNREPDPYAQYYFPGSLTLFMGSVQGLVLMGLGMVVKSLARQNQPLFSQSPL